MNNPIQIIDQETLFGRAIPSLSDEQAEQLISPIIEQIKAKLSTTKLKVIEKAHLKATIHWLQNHQPLDSSLEEQIQGYLEACDHLCKIELWPVAYQIFSLRLPFLPDYIFYENLGIWGYYREQIEIGKKLIEKISKDVDSLCLFEMGNAYSYLGQYQEALNHHQKLLFLGIQQENQKIICQAYGGIGNIYYKKNKLDLAIEYYQSQLKLSQQIQLVAEEVLALGGLATCFEFHGKSQKSLSFVSKIIDQIHQVNDLRILSSSYLDIGAIMTLSQNYHQGVDYLQKSLSFSRRIYNQQLICKVIAFLGTNLAMSVNIEKGIEILDQALNFARKKGDLSLEMMLSNNLAVIYYWKIKNQQKSIFYLEKSLKVAYFLEDGHAKSHILAHLSFHYNCIKNYDLSSQYAEQALFFAKQTKIKSDLALVFAIRANSYWVNGNYLKAMVLLIRSLIILPPWQNVNGNFIWQRFVELLKLKITGKKA